jgi:hypothetical protein
MGIVKVLAAIGGVVVVATSVATTFNLALKGRELDRRREAIQEAIRRRYAAEQRGDAAEAAAMTRVIAFLRTH